MKPMCSLVKKPFIITCLALFVFLAEGQNYVQNGAGDCGVSCYESPGLASKLIQDQFNEEKFGLSFSPNISVERLSFDLKKEDFKLEGDLFQTLNYRYADKFKRGLIKREKRWAGSALRMGLRMTQGDKSFGSAFWSEVKKPILYGIRDSLREPYRRKRRLRNKLKVWALEQTLDVGAASMGIDSQALSPDTEFDHDFGVRNIKSSFYLRTDPYKGRFGVRWKLRKWAEASPSPLVGQISLNYCNSEWGPSSRLCSYKEEAQLAIFLNKIFIRDSRVAFYLSYQTKSPDEGVYSFKGEAYEHKPFAFAVRFRTYLP